MKIDSEGKDDAAYKTLMSEMDMKALIYEAVAKDWDSNPNEWYLALIAIKDLPIVLAIPDLKAYTWCQCKLVADDGSEAHYHWHGLFQVESSEVGRDKLDESILSFRCQRTCLRESSALTMSFVCCVPWHAKATGELVVEMEMVS